MRPTRDLRSNNILWGCSIGYVRELRPSVEPRKPITDHRSSNGLPWTSIDEIRNFEFQYLNHGGGPLNVGQPLVRRSTTVREYYHQLKPRPGLIFFIFLLIQAFSSIIINCKFPFQEVRHYCRLLFLAFDNYFANSQQFNFREMIYVIAL